MDFDDQMDVDDEIVREIDVFISPELSKQVYLMQFPLQHGRMPIADAARIKKQHNMIELEHKIPQNIGSDGSFYLQKRKLVSHTIPITTHMALGKVGEDGALHLIPLNHITQMRPDFSHVDEVDPQSSEVEEPDPNKKAMEKKPLMFQKKESERAALARKSSYNYKRASEDGEEWAELLVCGPQSPEYRASEKNITSAQQSTTIASVNEGKDFVKSLDYLPTRIDKYDDEPQDGISPLVSVVKRMTAMLHRGVPVPYSVIRPQFPKVDDVDLLKCLSSCAVLVRGNFYLQSRLLPWDIEIMGARNFILLVFQTMGCAQRVGLEMVYKNTLVSKEWIQIILDQVALRGSNGWTPRLTDNADFCHDFPEQVQLHSQYWERQEQKCSTKLAQYRAGV
jgi:DNA-directed RNA polymerase-3 subunit RPC5